MRHKYETRGILLGRSSVGEASSFVFILSPELGLVRALAQSVRKPSAKLAAALVTFAESDIVLVRGKDGWRLAGAVLGENWFRRMTRTHARETAARVVGLVLRLVAGEEKDVELFSIMKGFLEALATLPEGMDESIETLTVLRVLASLGLDAGEISGEPSEYSLAILADIKKDRAPYVARINRGIEASGL